MAPADAAQLVAATAAYVRDVLTGEGSGHDWWHVARVTALARRIAAAEGADPLTTELAALLHDIADYKDTGDEESGARETTAWLQAQGAPPELVTAVAGIVRDLSFKGAGVPEAELGLAGRCVRDADRLDALGAIGIARTFAWGGSRGRALWDPDHPPQRHDTTAAYRASQSDPNASSVNHFHEKLLLLADRMSTPTGLRIGRRRHEVMERFLADFHAEWDGEDG